MNILFYEFGINPLKGGVQRVSYNIARKLKADGNKTYVAFKDEDVFSEIYHSVFCDYIKVNSLNDTILKELIDFVKLYKIDKIINQCGCGLEDTVFLNKVRNRCKIKLYSFVHVSPTASRDVLGFRDLRFPQLLIRSVLKEIIYCFYKFDKAKYKRIFACSDKVVLLSKTFVPDFASMIELSKDDGRVVVIPNIITFKTIQKEAILSQKEKIVLVVSRMGETTKRLSRVLDAWNLVYRELEEWKLIFVGDGDNLLDYKRIVKNMRLNNVEFAGIQDPFLYYMKASIFLMSSATEGFGMTILEAQQLGCVPIVMDSYKAVRDIIEDELNGFITPNGDIVSFSEKIKSLVHDDAKRRQMALGAIENSSRFFSRNIYPLWGDLLKR